jgi:Acyl-CoA dehydrogenases
VFGKAIGDYQGARWKLAEMYREIETARSILYRACITANPFPDPLMAAVAKITCNEMSNRVTSEAIQLHGGSVSPMNSRYRVSIAGALRDARRRHLRDAARSDRQADHGRGGAGRELLAYDMMNGG